MSNMQIQNMEEEVQKAALPQIQEEPAVQVQQKNEGIEVNYPSALGALMAVAGNHKDLVNFAYYLYKQNWVEEHPYDDAEWIGIRQRVNFCDCTKYRSTYGTTMDVSRLEQMYIASIFLGNYYTVQWAQKQYFPENTKGRCENCYVEGDTNYPLCPYFLCHAIVKAAEVYKVTPETIFDDILGDAKIDFRGTQVNAIQAAIPAEELEGIHAKSAHSAYLLLLGKMVAVHSVEDDTVNYSHLPLCRNDQKSSVVDDMIAFWQAGSGVTCSLHVADRTSLLHAKTEGCKKCTFEQCPHKLAAYFSYLGRKYNVDPIDLAYHAAQNNTYAGIAIRDNYQFNRFLDNVKKAPMREESKAEYIKMIHYIAGRKVNKVIPFLPFNMVISSPDKEKAHEIVQDYCDALWHFDYFRRGSDNTFRKDIYISSLSFGELCAEYQEAKPATTIILHDISLLCGNKDFEAGYHRLLKIMEDRRESVMSIVVGEKEKIAVFFASYPAFKEKIFAKTLEMFDMDSESVLEALENKLTQTFTIPEDVYHRLDQYIRVAYPSSPLRGMAFVNDLYEKLLFNHYNYDVNASAQLRSADIPYVKPPRSEAEIFDELDRLTGMANVKKELRNVHHLVKFNIKMGTNNKNAINLHMVFSGNPGTGKTTVARLTAEILHSIGFIQENKVVECSAKDLIGKYTGQTTPTTAKKCEQAYNGVLFIDEAYQLNPYTGHEADTFKEECIAELIQQMENNRDKLVVIFAGYTEEMEDFLNRANTGLRSRIGKTIHFPDYSSAELLEIFTDIVARAGMHLGVGAGLRALEIFETAKKDAERFGNARYARNLYERSLLQHAAITANLDKDDPALRILSHDEITVPNS